MMMVLALLTRMPDLTRVTIRTEHVAGNVYMLEASGGSVNGANWSSRHADVARHVPIEAALEGIGSGRLRFILNTHFHDDHSDGNENLGASATIIAHTNTRKRLLHKGMGHWPEVTFVQEATVHFNDEEIRAVHYPAGHTDSDIVILLY